MTKNWTLACENLLDEYQDKPRGKQKNNDKHFQSGVDLRFMQKRKKKLWQRNGGLFTIQISIISNFCCEKFALNTCLISHALILWMLWHPHKFYCPIIIILCMCWLTHHPNFSIIVILFFVWDCRSLKNVLFSYCVTVNALSHCIHWCEGKEWIYMRSRWWARLEQEWMSGMAFAQVIYCRCGIGCVDLGFLSYLHILFDMTGLDN